MRRVLLAPRSFGLHGLLVVCLVAFTFLGRWQWHRAMAPSGGLQNLLYALQWWSFAVIAVIGWWKMLRDLATPRAADGTRLAGTGTSGAAPVPGVVRPATAVAVDDEDDEELAAYNRWLAALNRQAELNAQAERAR